MKKITVNLLVVLIHFLLLNSCGSSAKNENDTVMMTQKNKEVKYLKTKRVATKPKTTHVSLKSIIWKSNSKDFNGNGDDDNVIIYVDDDYFTKTNSPTKPTLTICINNACFEQKTNWSMGGFYGDETKFEIININKNDHLKELLISYRVQDTEDPPYDRAIIRFFKNNTITVSTLKFAHKIDYMNNSITVNHDNYNTIIRGTYVLDGMYLKQKKLYKKPKKSENIIMAACPYVYLSEGTSKTFQGEILRNLRADYMEGWQYLKLNISQKKYNSINVTLSEEKDEVTFLNAVYLVADGTKYLPKISEDRYSKIISDDEDYIKMKKGEVIKLEFNLEGKAIRDAKLFAKGYYIPIVNKDL